jgi:hypothetical protein
MDAISRLMMLLWWVYLASLSILIVRFIVLNAVHRYPALFTYLISDLIASIVGLIVGRAADIYYWTYFFLTTILGSGLIILISREMFSEIYYFHPGLRGMTRLTLNRAIVAGAVLTLFFIPVVLIHWGEPGFNCWQLPMIEIHRSLKFGQCFFILLMWRRLRWLPLQIPDNIRVYSWCVGCYSFISGILLTIELISHNPLTSVICSNVLLAVSIIFCIAVFAGFKRPDFLHEPIPMCPIPDREIIERLTTVEGLMAQLDEAAAFARKRAAGRFRVRVTAPLGASRRLSKLVQRFRPLSPKLRGLVKISRADHDVQDHGI